MSIRAKRGTRAQINAARTANELIVGELIHVTDENVLAIATATNAYTDLSAADLSNVSQADARTKVGTGTMAYRAVTISTSDPSGGSNGDIWLKV